MCWEYPEFFSFTELTRTARNLPNCPKDWRTISNLLRLGIFLDRVRLRFNRPIRVNCAFRSTEVNKAVGGVATSFHLKGLAADICAYSGTEADNRLLLSILEQRLEEGNVDQLISYHRTAGDKTTAIRFIHVGIGEEDEFGTFKNRGQRLYK